MQVIQKITPCLWFDDQAEEAVEFYAAIFRNSKIVNIARYGQAGHEIHGRPAGTGGCRHRASRRLGTAIRLNAEDDRPHAQTTASRV